MDCKSLTYREVTTFKISSQNIINFIKNNISEVVITETTFKNGFYFYIPQKSANPVYYSCSISYPNNNFHNVQLRYPCSIHDLQIFVVITEYFQTEFKKSKIFFNYQEHNHYDKYFYTPMMNILKSNNYIIAWQNLMTSYFKENKTHNIFSVSNNILQFSLSANFLGLSNCDENFNENIMNATLAYIWRADFLNIETNEFCIMISHNSEKTRIQFITAIEWNNKANQLFSVYSYILFQVDGEFVAVKPKNWLPYLLPYLQQYDTNNSTQLMPVLNNDLYKKIISALYSFQVNLKFYYKEIDDKKEWSASVKQ